MTSSNDFDRRLTNWLDTEAPPRAPEYVLPSTFAVTARTRQRPGWLVPERWIPMNTTTRLAGVPRAAVLTAVLIALLILAAMGFVAAGGRLPSLGSPHNPIAFRSTRDGQDQVYSMNVDGSNQTRLSSGNAKEEPSGWSPDGAKLAFASERNGVRGIYVMNGDGGSVRLLMATSNPVAAAKWSPDGKTIAFHEDTSGAGCYETFVMAADGTNPHQVTPDGSCNWAPGWSPDGTKLAIGSTRDGDFDIYVMNPDGSAATQVGARSGRNDAFPVFSPDGTKIAFTSWDTNLDPNTADVYVMNVDGTGRTQLTSNGVEDSYPAWSPDGRQLAFESARDGNLEIYVMNADGSNPTRLTHDPGEDAGAVWN
jgi:Tol biopolymer transport system component